MKKLENDTSWFGEWFITFAMFLTLLLGLNSVRIAVSAAIWQESISYAYGRAGHSGVYFRTEAPFDFWFTVFYYFSFGIALIVGSICSLRTSKSKD